MERKDTLKIKKDSYECNMNARQKARADRKRAKNMKSPDVTKKKYSYYDADRRCWMFADSKQVINNMKDNL